MTTTNVRAHQRTTKRGRSIGVRHHTRRTRSGQEVRPGPRVTSTQLSQAKYLLDIELSDFEHHPKTYLTSHGFYYQPHYKQIAEKREATLTPGDVRSIAQRIKPASEGFKGITLTPELEKAVTDAVIKRVFQASRRRR